MNFSDLVTGAAGSVTNQNNQVTQITYQIQKAAKGVMNFAREFGDSIPYFLNKSFQEESEEENQKKMITYLIQYEIEMVKLKELNLKSSTKYNNEMLVNEQLKIKEQKRHNQVSENINLQKLELQYIELEFSIQHRHKELILKEREIKINEDKMDLGKKRLELEGQILELKREWQHQQLEKKSEEIQGLWDAQKSPLTLSQQETKDFLLRQHKDCDLFILFSPLEISQDSELKKISINQELEIALDNCINEFYNNSLLGCRTQFYQIFEKPIKKLEAENFIHKFSPIPIIIFYGNITNSKIYIKISFLQQSTIIEMNWRDIYNELLSLGVTLPDTIYLVKDFLIDFYKVAVSYIVDLYYLYIKNFHEIRLPELVNNLLSQSSYQWLINNIYEHSVQDLIDTQKQRNSLAYYQKGYKYYQASLQTGTSYQIEKKLFENALLFIEESVKVKSDFSHAWYVKGVIEFKIKKYTSTIESCNQAIKVDLNYAHAWLYKAKAYEKIAQQQGNQNDWDIAISCYKKAIDLQPQLKEALEDYGLLLCQIKNYEKAITVFDDYIDINSKSEVVWFAKGNSLFYLKLYKKSIQSYQKVIEINENNHNAWLLRGEAAFKIWDIETAIYSFYRAIKINQKNLYIIIQFLIKSAKNTFKKLLNILSKWGRYSEAVIKGKMD